MAAATHPGQPQLWSPLLQPPTVKTEPIDEAAYSREKHNSFYSDGFQSASPSSSKDSNANSPNSVVGAGDASSFFHNNISLQATTNLHAIAFESLRNNIPYNLISPPEFKSLNKQGQESSPPYETAYSPRNIHPSHTSTPLNRPEMKSPSMSPDLENGKQPLERFRDSGFEPHGKNNGADDHNSTMEQDEEEEPGLRVPAVNSHGKVKTFKCKQCKYVAVTKLSFWEHTKQHIKPEKMLVCSKCPFVTEYKHHLEYHIRNHMGSKPFRCPECSYSCVNKSMLNSHLKSHSDIYQYRCANCNYASKYCHSLKLHLRKYEHNPAMVLNLDGTPNPLPIIDVYGTRRGPKRKPMSKLVQEHNPNNNPLPQPPPSMFGGFGVNLQNILCLPPPPLLNPSFLFQPNNNFEQKSQQPVISAEKMQSPPPSILHHRLSYGERTEGIVSSPPSRSPVHLPQSSPVTTDAPTQEMSALDLTNTKSEADSPPPTDQIPPSTPTSGHKSRRKGQAYKLQPAALRLQHEEEKKNMQISDAEDENPASEMSTDAHRCQHCDITFGDLAMHTIHMGFHGFNDPYMCNKCGERSADRVSFFIHLGRTQHA